MYSQFKNNILAKEANRLRRNLSPERACGDCGKERLPLNRKKPLAEPDSERVAIRLDQLGFEKTEKRRKKTP